ncbi:hypothetical protein [Pedobacter insulae]|uniref:Secreted protein n=1 Tax=Pedobacter insulae TaxID=414048 RepID=A0A1I2ZKR5_9SPHI|nr:hypothetical protein [Pedobacter insulae]SFH37711.1 hypothetical protein SAMN04489864_11059 [Pedobacter insulae]
MKKQILTLAVLATLAVGGAIAATKMAAPPYYNSNGDEVDCSGSTTSCEIIELYSEPDPELQGPQNRIPTSEVEGLSFDEN